MCDSVLDCSNTLYVGNLHTDVDEALLLEIFIGIGPVLSIRLCRQMETGKSMGYAFVNFKEHHDAQRALNILKFEIINEKPMDILWAKDNPLLRKPNAFGSIYVKNLDKFSKFKEIHEEFGQFGDIQDLIISKDDDQSLNVIISYENEIQANDAIRCMDGKILNSNVIRVEKYIPSMYNRTPVKNGKCMNVFIKNFGDLLDDKKLRQLFEKYGRIISVKVMRDENGKSKGFGFVRFDKFESAEKAIKEMNAKVINGRVLYVGRAQKKSERQRELKQKFEEMKYEKSERYHGMNLYIKNLAEIIDDSRLRKEFSPFGTRISSKVMKDEFGISKGFGFVCYSSVEEATIAVCEMNNRLLEGKPLYVTLAQSKEERAAQREMFLEGLPGAKSESESEEEDTVSNFNQSMVSYCELLDGESGEEETSNSKVKTIQRLASLVQRWQPCFASEIMGVLLEMYSYDLQDLLASQDALKIKIDKLALGIQAQRIREDQKQLVFLSFL